MSGETGSSKSGWTVDTLHVHMQRQLDAMERLLDQRYAMQTTALDAALAAQQRATTTALAANDKKLDSMNEVREQLARQAATMMTRAESIARHDAAAEKIDDLGTRLDKMDGRGAGLSAGWGILVAVVGLVVSALLIWSMVRGG